MYFETFFFFWFFSQFWINYLAGGARMEKYLVPLLPLLFIFLNQLVITKGTYFWRKHLQGSPSNGCAKKAKMLNSSLLFYHSCVWLIYMSPQNLRIFWWKLSICQHLYWNIIISPHQRSKLHLWLIFILIIS